MTSNLKQIRDMLIEDFGKGYANFGQPKLKGRIVGLMTFSNKPLTLDDICEALGVSKGPVSTIARQLEESGLLRKVWVKGDRKDYYQIVEDMFTVSSRINLKYIKQNLEIAQRNSHLLSKVEVILQGDELENCKAVLQRMEEMKEFYTLLIDVFQKFITDWERKFIEHSTKRRSTVLNETLD
ncbi:MAG: GbsR/MarR family transcriptional regulator [bacterium]